MAKGSAARASQRKGTVERDLAKSTSVFAESATCCRKHVDKRGSSERVQLAGLRQQWRSRAQKREGFFAAGLPVAEPAEANRHKAPSRHTRKREP